MSCWLRYHEIWCNQASKYWAPAHVFALDIISLSDVDIGVETVLKDQTILHTFQPWVIGLILSTYIWLRDAECLPVIRA